LHHTPPTMLNFHSTKWFSATNCSFLRLFFPLSLYTHTHTHFLPQHLLHTHSLSLTHTFFLSLIWCSQSPTFSVELLSCVRHTPASPSIPPPATPTAHFSVSLRVGKTSDKSLPKNFKSWKKHEKCQQLKCLKWILN